MRGLTFVTDPVIFRIDFGNPPAQHADLPFQRVALPFCRSSAVSRCEIPSRLQSKPLFQRVALGGHIEQVRRQLGILAKRAFLGVSPQSAPAAMRADFTAGLQKSVALGGHGSKRGVLISELLLLRASETGQDF